MKKFYLFLIFIPIFNMRAADSSIDHYFAEEKIRQNALASLIGYNPYNNDDPNNPYNPDASADEHIFIIFDLFNHTDDPTTFLQFASCSQIQLRSAYPIASITQHNGAKTKQESPTQKWQRQILDQSSFLSRSLSKQ